MSVHALTNCVYGKKIHPRQIFPEHVSTSRQSLTRFIFCLLIYDSTFMLPTTSKPKSPRQALWESFYSPPSHISNKKKRGKKEKPPPDGSVKLLKLWIWHPYWSLISEHVCLRARDVPRWATRQPAGLLKKCGALNLTNYCCFGCEEVKKKKRQRIIPAGWKTTERGADETDRQKEIWGKQDNEF